MNKPIKSLIRITSSYFCAGYDMETDNIAPIIKYMKGWNLSRILLYCKTKGWKVEVINGPNSSTSTT